MVNISPLLKSNKQPLVQNILLGLPGAVSAGLKHALTHTRASTEIAAVCLCGLHVQCTVHGCVSLRANLSIVLFS